MNHFPNLNTNEPVVSNTPLNNSALDDQLFTDDSLNNFGSNTPNNNQTIQSENVDTIFDTQSNIQMQPVNNVSNQPINQSIEPTVSTPVNNIQTEEPKVEPKQKKSKGPVVVIILLLLIVLGLAGYIVYDKFLSKDTKEPETKEEEKTTLKEVKDTKLIEQLRSELVAINTYGLGGLVEGLYHNTKMTSQTIDDKKLLLFNIFKYVEENNIDINETKSTIDSPSIYMIKSTIPKTDITTYMQNKYNTKLEYSYKASTQYEQLGIIGSIVILVDDTNYYVASVPGADGSYHLNTKLVKAEEDKENIYIYDKAAYSVFALNIARSFDTLDNSDYYDNEKHEYMLDKVLIDCQDDPTTAEQDIKKSDKCPFTGTMDTVTPDSVSKYIYENMSDKLRTYKHTFKKLDGNYYWVSSEVVE